MFVADITRRQLREVLQQYDEYVSRFSFFEDNSDSAQKAFDTSSSGLEIALKAYSGPRALASCCVCAQLGQNGTRHALNVG